VAEDVVSHRTLRKLPIALLIGAIAGCCAVLGCSANTGSGSTQREVRIGYQKSSSLLNLLRTRKTLEQAYGPDVRVVWQEFVAGPQLLEALNIGSVDFGTTGEAPPVFAQAAGAPLVYVARERVGPATEAILVRPDSPHRSIADLKGKRIALNKGSNVHYFLVRALEAAGLKYEDVQPVFLTPADARVAFQGGRVDAWAIWDPFLTAAVESGEARVLIDGTGLVENYSYFLTTRDFSSEHPDLLKRLLEEIRLVSAWARDHREEVAAFMSEYLEMELAYLRIAEHRRQYEMTEMAGDAVEYQQRVADTFFKLRLIPNSVQIADALPTDIEDRGP